MNQLIIGLSILLVGGLCNCQGPTYVSEAELHAYAQDAAHGLRQEKNVNGLQVALQYQPTDLLVAQELNGSRSPSLVDSLRQKYGQYAYFILSLSAKNKDALYQSTNHGKFSEKLQTLSFRMNEYAQLVTSKQDTVPVGDFTFPRLYGHGTSTDILFAFARKQLDTDKWIQFDLKDFGMGTGTQRFRFRKQDWQQAPQIAF